MPTIRALGEDDVRSLMTSALALDIARRTLVDQAAGNSGLSTPSAMSLDATQFGSGRFKFKAANVGHLGASGIRLISRRSATDPHACNYCAVYNHGGVELSGLVAELWLSRIRTAAFGAATIEKLANPGPQTVALFGTGKIANELVPMLAQILDVRELRVTSRRPESRDAFVAAHAPKLPFPMRVEPDAARMVPGADVVITLTEANAPLVMPGALAQGAVLCSMGGNHEIDFGVLAECQRFIADDVDFASEVGDGGAWIRQGHMTRETFAARFDTSTCEVVAGLKPARHTPQDRILAIVQGMAVGDVAFAIAAMREAERLGRGKVIELP